jgi:hypothetical protein
LGTFICQSDSLHVYHAAGEGQVLAGAGDWDDGVALAVDGVDEKPKQSWAPIIENAKKSNMITVYR